MKQHQIFGETIKQEFPLLKQSKIIYVDNAATTQKPQQVIDAMNNYYNNYNSNVHRGIHTLSEKATDFYEQARKTISNFINANEDELIFSYGTTHGINTLAFGLKHILKKDDEIVISEMEHHANIVPWQEVAKQTGSKLIILPINEQGEISSQEINKIISKKTKILSLSHTSNVLGTKNDVKQIIQIAKSISPEIITIIDGAQEIAHSKIDVKQINCDAYVFSAHKIFGPTGVGAIYMNKTLQEKTNPLLYGGSMIEDVSFEKTKIAKGIQKFEAGTPPIAGIIGFAEAIKFMNSIDMNALNKYEQELTHYFMQKAQTIKGMSILGPSDSQKRCPVFSFTIENINPQDLSTFLNEYNIATRSGHHCAIPLHKKYQINGTTRISLSFYNTKEEIDNIFEAINNIKKIFNF